MKQKLTQRIYSGFLLLLLCALCSIAAFSQALTLKGKITAADGSAVAGANVSVKGSSRTVVTDVNGNYTIEVPKANATLIVTYVGYAPQELTAGTTGTLNITLKEESRQMEEVVVTAMGIKKEVKKLGYAVQEVKGSELTKARDANAVNSLAGKIAGLSVGASAEMLGRPELVLRGSKDLLFVVDGAPVNSDTWNISADDIETYSILKGPNAAALYGSRGINGAIVITTKRGSKSQRGWQVDFNSSTLFDKGFVAAPKAQTEYGRGTGYFYDYQAKNGAGAALYTPQADVLYDNANRLGEFGPRFEGQLLRQYDSPYDPVTGVRQRTPWTARGKDNFKNFVETGITSTNNIAVSASGSNYDVRMSYSHMYQKGIFPNTRLNSDNLNINAGYNITPKLRLEGNVNLNIQYSPNIPDVNYGPNSYMYMFKVYGSADYDVRDLKDYYKGPMGVPNLVQYAQEYGRLNNPWFMADKWLRGHDKTDIYAYLKLSYKITDDLTAAFRSQVTTWNQKRTEDVPSSANLNAYTTWYKFGWYGDYREDNRRLLEDNNDLTLNYGKKFSNWNLNVLGGANSRSFTYHSIYGTTKSLALPGVYTLSNTLNPSPIYNWDSKMQVYSGYYSVDLGYNKYFNINTTGRVDHLSTLPKGHQAFFYTSASLATVLTDYLNLPSVISYLKLRGSVADVKGGLTQATAPSAYQQITGSTINSLLGYSQDVVTSYDGPSYTNQNTAAYASYYNGLPSINYSNTLADPNLKPYNRVSYEAGMDIRFLKNRVGLDVTYFSTTDGPQIFAKGVAPSTTNTYQNINGITTRRNGFELALNASPISSAKGLNWDVTINYSTFKEKLIKTYEGSPTLFLNNHNYKVGDRLDEIYGTKFVRDNAGNIFYSAGTLMKAPTDVNNLASLGHLNPDFTFGINNRFSFKNFNLAFQFDGRIGGKIYDYNYYANMQGGTAMETVQGVVGAARLKEWQSTKQGTQAPTAALIGNEFGAGVKLATGAPTPVFSGGKITNLDAMKGFIVPNDVPVLVEGYLNGALKANFDEYFMVSRSFAKLREVTFGYTFPQSVLGKSFIKGLTVSLVGRNLLYFAARKDFDIDQYASGFNASDRTAGGTAATTNLQSTTTRKFGVNVNVNF